MPRYRITVEYDGRGFVGWQHQKNGLSVQEALEQAIFRFRGEKVRVFGAGRTDAGVHALGQVAHFDLERAAKPATIRDAVNFHLKPHPAAVLEAAAVPDAFNARTSAKERAYVYRIVNRRAPLTLDAGRAWHMVVPLDAGAMHEAAQVLIGKHDFTTFRASQCQAKSPVKTLNVLTVGRFGDEIQITARARSFLHHQVRNIVGTLSLVGEGRWTAKDVAAALAARNRARGGPTAPAEGLYLTEVMY
jgi:tRNA pseudouridine38-40 synthase